jgi:hypothetical protein
MSNRPEPRLVARLTLPGEAAGKKTSGRVTFPGLLALRLPKSIGQLARARTRAAERGRNPQRVPRLVSSPEDLIQWAAENLPRDPSGVRRRLVEASGRVAPRIQPPTSHQTWHRQALKAAKAAQCPRPLVADGHLVEVEVVVYMAQGQRGDLINFQEAVWDLLEDAGLIQTDHWINGHGSSRRSWMEPWNPRVEVAVSDLGPRQVWKPPAVRVFNLPAAAEGTGAVRFRLVDGDAEAPGAAARGSSRAELLRTANQVALRTWGRPLGAGAEIYCEVRA